MSVVNNAVRQSSKSYEMFIDGKFVSANRNCTISVINPATEEIISEVPRGTAADVDAAVVAAERAQKSWAKLPPIARAAHLREIAQHLRQNREHLARTITEEQGKVLPLAEVEVSFAAEYMDYIAEFARRLEGEIIQSDRPNENIFLFKMPIGVAAGILPWNFPLFLIVRKMAPALLTGNTIVIKPSEETPNNAFEFASLVARSSLPQGVFNLVCGTGAEVGNALAGHPKVGIVSVTGSVATGAAVMRAAAPNITKVSLELGGKAPAIIMTDADIDLAVKAICASRLINAGQVCNCAERVYVQEPVADEFVDKVTKAMAASTVGDPFAPGVDLGPLVNKNQLDKVADAVEQAVKDGAQLLIGGKRYAGRTGYYYPPTVLSKCAQRMPIMQKEIFGPVLPIATFHKLDEAIEMANDCEYGLTSSIYTRSLDIAMRACNEIKFGETYINRENFEAMQAFHSGWRKSGIGGADGAHGLEEYLCSHVVYIQHAAATN